MLNIEIHTRSLTFDTRQGMTSPMNNCHLLLFDSVPVVKWASPPYTTVQATAREIHPINHKCYNVNKQVGPLKIHNPKVKTAAWLALKKTTFFTLAPCPPVHYITESNQHMMPIGSEACELQIDLPRDKSSFQLGSLSINFGANLKPALCRETSKFKDNLGPAGFVHNCPE